MHTIQRFDAHAAEAILLFCELFVCMLLFFVCTLSGFVVVSFFSLGLLCLTQCITKPHFRLLLTAPGIFSEICHAYHSFSGIA